MHTASAGTPAAKASVPQGTDSEAITPAPVVIAPLEVPPSPLSAAIERALDPSTEREISARFEDLERKIQTVRSEREAALSELASAQLSAHASPVRYERAAHTAALPDTDSDFRSALARSPADRSARVRSAYRSAWYDSASKLDPKTISDKSEAAARQMANLLLSVGRCLVGAALRRWSMHAFASRKHAKTLAAWRTCTLLSGARESQLRRRWRQWMTFRDEPLRARKMASLMAQACRGMLRSALSKWNMAVAKTSDSQQLLPSAVFQLAVLLMQVHRRLVLSAWRRWTGSQQKRENAT